MKLTLNEIFYSIQGESYLAGLPCVFIRLTGCHQRCVYCDTSYAFYEGHKVTVSGIFAEIQKYDCQNVLITGGEPLLQANTPFLAQFLLDRGYRVAIETGGNRPIEVLPREVIKVMDLKTPGSGESHRNRYENLTHLETKDEVKFVVVDEHDVDWSLGQIQEHQLVQRCHVSLSPTRNEFLPRVAQKILDSGLRIRLQHQFHKTIWPGMVRGV